MYRTIASVVALVTALMFLGAGAHAAPARQCPIANPAGPTTPSRAQTLNGKLIYHDDVRGWFELKLDKPMCGQGSVQLIYLDGKSNAFEVVRGCRVKSSGPIDISETGYYSSELYQSVTNLEPVGECSRHSPFPDYSKAKPDKHVLAYTVDMYVDYGPGDHPVIFQVRSAGRQLLPWQAYASYWLTGSQVLYGQCGHGFVVDKVFGTPAAGPSHFDTPRTSLDMAEFDPEGAAASGKTDLHLGYTCIRDPAP